MGFRRKARECALQILFELDFHDEDRELLMSRYWANHHCPENARVFAEQLVEGTMEHMGEIDRLVAECAHHWKIERMIGVDRNILRFATYEILYREDIPVKVTIDEALEVAKKYSADDSAKFINGILDKIAKCSSMNNTKVSNILDKPSKPDCPQ